MNNKGGALLRKICVAFLALVLVVSCVILPQTDVDAKTVDIGTASVKHTESDNNANVETRTINISRASTQKEVNFISSGSTIVLSCSENLKMNFGDALMVGYELYKDYNYVTSYSTSSPAGYLVIENDEFSDGAGTYSLDVYCQGYTSRVVMVVRPDGSRGYEYRYTASGAKTWKSFTVRFSHSWKDATCTKPKTCTGCGATSGSALGHSWRDATCTKPKTCTGCGTTSGSALGHSYTYRVSKAPTVSSTGSLNGTCYECYGTTTVTLPKLNTTNYTYRETKTPTCTTTGTGRYTWKTTAYGTFYFDVSVEKAAHKWNEATCYKAKTCSVCGTTSGSALGHQLVDDVCSRCGYIEYMLGDLDNSDAVDNADVEYLLWHTLFPQNYPLNQNADFDGTDTVDNNDVEYLLWHTLFPADWPL